MFKIVRIEKVNNNEKHLTNSNKILFRSLLYSLSDYYISIEAI